MNEVVAIYNPYKYQCRIIINDTTVSNFSTLVGFMNTPFHKWCDAFIEKLEGEINGKYNLKFVSRKTEIDIIKFYISESKFCQDFFGEEFVLNEPLTKRMSRLNKFFLNKLVTPKNKIIINSFFYINESLKSEKECLSNLEIKNEYCEVIAKVSSELFIQDEKSTFFCISSSINQAKELLNQYKTRQNPWFIILVGNENKIVGKEKNCFIFQTTESKFMERVFECFLFVPLLEVFLLARKGINNKQIQESMEYKLLDEVDPVINIKSQYKVEVGEAILLVREIYPPEAGGVELTFTYEPENIAICDGRIIKGINSGDVKISIFKKGGFTPLNILAINVYKLNRIEQVFIDETYLQISVGDNFKLNDSYIPENADDYNKLQWVSENTDIVTIDSNGCVCGKNAGVTRVKRIVNRVEAECQVVVKEIMNDFLLSSQKIEMFVGESYPLTFKTYPINCFDENVSIYIEHKDLVSYYKDKIYGENPGQTTITFFTTDKRIVKKCSVTVLKKLNLNTSESKKKGVLSFLLKKQSE